MELFVGARSSPVLAADVHAEFAENPGDVGLRRRLAQVQVRCKFLVGSSLADGAQDFYLVR